MGLLSCSSVRLPDQLSFPPSVHISVCLVFSSIWAVHLSVCLMNLPVVIPICPSTSRCRSLSLSLSLGPSAHSSVLSIYPIKTNTRRIKQSVLNRVVRVCVVARLRGQYGGLPEHSALFRGRKEAPAGWEVFPEVWPVQQGECALAVLVIPSLLTLVFQALLHSEESLIFFFIFFFLSPQALKHFLKCPNTDDNVAIEMAIETVRT